MLARLGRVRGGGRVREGRLEVVEDEGGPRARHGRVRERVRPAVEERLVEEQRRRDGLGHDGRRARAGVRGRGAGALGVERRAPPELERADLRLAGARGRRGVVLEAAREVGAVHEAEAGACEAVPV